KEGGLQWKLVRRDRLHVEQMGRVVAIVGACKLFHGLGYSYLSYRSQIYEGDEVECEDDSYLWILLKEGTLVRLAPKSEVAFQEINLGRQKNFLYVRIHKGLVYWYSRVADPVEESDLFQTETLFFPLRYFAANPLPPRLTLLDSELTATLDQGVDSKLLHVKRLNQLILLNNSYFKKSTHSLLVLPNGNLEGMAMRAMIFVNSETGISYVRSYSEQSKLTLRGYNEYKSEDLLSSLWYKIDRLGKTTEEFSRGETVFSIAELIVKRIHSILTARELMLYEDSRPLFSSGITAKAMATLHGYRLWEDLRKDDLDLRIKFLQEHTRKVETTLLISKSRLKQKLIDIEKEDSELRADLAKKIKSDIISDYSEDFVFQNIEDVGDDIETETDETSTPRNRFSNSGYDHSYHRLAVKSYLDLLEGRSHEDLVNDWWWRMWVENYGRSILESDFSKEMF
ncbi:MAG: hypothetical protein HQK50_06055, partial [Oligoflexia bacterium]|nr:hypothetical protein [Oligoflexia bacterium]